MANDKIKSGKNGNMVGVYGIIKILGSGKPKTIDKQKGEL